MTRTPFHVEAYPRLDLKETVAELAHGRTHVFWRDQNGLFVGVAMLSTRVPGKLTVNARFRHLPYIPHGAFHDEIAFHVINRDTGKVDILSTCRSCKQTRKSLVFRKDIWLCRTCQELTYRSAIVSAGVRDGERLAELDVLLAHGRPRYMHLSKYSDLAEERTWLKLVLGEARAQAPAHQRWELARLWRAETDPMIGMRSLSASGDNSARSDVLDLMGQPLFAGPTLHDQIEGQIRKEVGPAYTRARAEVGRVSQLHLRRRFRIIELGPVPVLDTATEVRLNDAGQETAQASLTVPFEGDAAYFRASLAHSQPAFLPVGHVAQDELVLSARFSRENEPFVTALLEEQLRAAEQCLVQLRGSRTAIEESYPAAVKRVVAEQWPKLISRPRKR